MEIKTYTTEKERLAIVKELQDKGLVQIHDDFIDKGGRLTFDVPKENSAEQIANELEAKELDSAISKLLESDLRKRLYNRLKKRGLI